MYGTVVSSALVQTRCAARIVGRPGGSFSTETVSESGAAGIARRLTLEPTFVVNMAKLKLRMSKFAANVRKTNVKA
jgi:hypothetical protein